MSRENVSIPFEGRIKSSLKEGDVFEKGATLFEVDKRKRLASYSLPEDLGTSAENSRDFVNRIEGEYISKNDVIAERLVSGGLLSKRILSDYDGIVSLKNINLGYVNILSELGVERQVASFNGIVKNRDIGRGLDVETDVCSIPLFYSNVSSEKEDFWGSFEIITDTGSLPSSRNMADSFEGKIVFAGRFLYPELAKELFKRGAKFILVGSMNYDDLKTLDIPIGVLTGFGNIFFDSILLDFFKQLNGFQISVLPSSGIVQFPVGLNDRISQLFEQNYYTHAVKKGDIVRSVGLESFGLIGKVFDLKDGFAEVLTQEGLSITVDVNNLEVYNEEFSLMRMRIF
jgi:hypothetical protein